MIFIKENPFENVIWKMSAILSRPPCVNIILYYAEPFHVQYILLPVIKKAALPFSCNFPCAIEFIEFFFILGDFQWSSILDFFLSIFTQILTKERVRYEVTFVFISDAYFASVIVVPYAKSCYVGLLYKGTWLLVWIICLGATSDTNFTSVLSEISWTTLKLGHG